MTADHPTPAEDPFAQLRLMVETSDPDYVFPWRAGDAAVLLAELARRDAALADLTRQRDEAQAELAVVYDLLAAERIQHNETRAQLERQAPVIEAATRYELAWDQYASFTKHPGINEGQRIATKARAHQELLDVVRALGPVDPEATADDPFDTGAPEHAPPPEAKEVPAGPTDLMAALRASLERAKAARADATPAPLHVEDGNGGEASDD